MKGENLVEEEEKLWMGKRGIEKKYKHRKKQLVLGVQTPRTEEKGSRCAGRNSAEPMSCSAY